MLTCSLRIALKQMLVPRTSMLIRDTSVSETLEFVVRNDEDIM